MPKDIMKGKKEHLFVAFVSCILEIIEYKRMLHICGLIHTREYPNKGIVKTIDFL